MPFEVAILIGTVLIVLLFLLIWFTSRRTESPPPAQPTQGVPEPLDQPPAQYSRLVLGDVDHPFAVIEPFDSPVESRLNPLPVSKQQLGQLQTIFQHAPALAQRALTARPNMYELRFPPEVAEGIRSGSFKVMESVEGDLRGVAIDAQTKKVVSQGTLIPNSRLRMANVAAGVFQILTIVAVEQYLAEINNRLLHVEQGIQDIKAHLAAQDRAILVDSLKQLKSLKLLMEEGNFQDREILAGLISLDTIDRDCGRVLEAYREHMERYRSELDELALSSMFNPDFAAATEKAAQFEKAALISLQAMYVKSVTAQFRYAIPGGYPRLAQANLEDLKTDLEAWYKDLTTFAWRFKERIHDDATAPLGNNDTLAKQRKEIARKANQRQKSTMAMHDELKQAISNAADHVDRQLSTSSEPLTLVVKLNEQKEIEQVYESGA